MNSPPLIQRGRFAAPGGVNPASLAGVAFANIDLGSARDPEET